MDLKNTLICLQYLDYTTIKHSIRAEYSDEYLTKTEYIIVPRYMLGHHMSTLAPKAGISGNDK